MNIEDLAIYLVPLALIAFFYLRRQHKNAALPVEQPNGSIGAGLAETSSRHPEINPRLCLGSGGCIKACPESAIGMINGKAVLINPASCIGHGDCEAAYPHDAITLVYGTERRGIDTP